MIPSLLHSIASNLWMLLLALLFFDASIFVHELGHYWTARRRGLRVERFAIGIGPTLFSWRNEAGVEFTVGLIPVMGYVRLPQIADLTAIEGASEAEVARLPAVSYGSKMLVLVAGAAGNFAFAFALACVIWIVGQPQPTNMATTRIGYVAPTLQLANGVSVPSPAAQGGLRAGDRILAIDGAPVHDWEDVSSHVQLGSGRTPSGRPSLRITVERGGTPFTLTLHPVLAGSEGWRQIGIEAAWKPIVAEVAPGSPAARAGLKPGDQLLAVGAAPVLSDTGFFDYLKSHLDQPVAIHVLRDGHSSTLMLAPRTAASPANVGIDALESDQQITHPSPVAQVWGNTVDVFRTLASLLNPHSNVGLSKMTSVIGIAHIYEDAAQVGLQALIALTILINVNLGIFNLLPIPVLDGGHMLFATIGWIRGRSLPLHFIVTAQSVFLVLIVIMFVYVSYFDVQRWASDIREDHAPPAPAANSAPARAKP